MNICVSPIINWSASIENLTLDEPLKPLSHALGRGFVCIVSHYEATRKKRQNFRFFRLEVETPSYNNPDG